MSLHSFQEHNHFYWGLETMPCAAWCMKLFDLEERWLRDRIAVPDTWREKRFVLWPKGEKADLLMEVVGRWILVQRELVVEMSRSPSQVCLRDSGHPEVGCCPWLCRSSVSLRAVSYFADWCIQAPLLGRRAWEEGVAGFGDAGTEAAAEGKVCIKDRDGQRGFEGSFAP